MSNFDAIIQAAKGRSKPASKALDESEPVTQSSPLSVFPSVLSIDLILERETNTREISPTHVAALAESIAVLGLLEPLVVDISDRLLAGGHRLAAIKLLREQNSIAYGQQFPNDLIPVRVLPFAAEAEPDRALQVEVAENEHRRDYTPAEVRNLADRLRSAGYVDQPGRPAKGTKALRPALEIIVGKSLRTVQRYLNQDGKPRQDVMVSESRLLKQALKSLQEWQTTAAKAKTPERKALLEKLPQMVELLEGVIDEIEA